MARNVKLRIKVEIIETDEEVSPARAAARQDVGDFSLVLPESDELNLSALDRAALDVSYPALRDAVQAHVEEAIKKNSPPKRQAKPKAPR
jgi:hypothetical protein